MDPQELYKEFVENFDPTPICYGEDYLWLPDFDTWLEDYYEAKENSPAK
jgi:hypothetical protein